MRQCLNDIQRTEKIKCLSKLNKFQKLEMIFADECVPKAERENSIKWYSDQECCKISLMKLMKD